MLVLVGPSASGKTEIANLLIKDYKMTKIVTCTTREKRIGEIDKVHYNFLSEKEFLDRKNEFVETTYYNGFYYGTLKKDISDDKIIVLDPSGVNNFYEKMPNDIISFYLDAKEEIRKDRMIFRKDKIEDIELRLQNDRNVFKIECIKHIDHVVDSSYRSLDELARIIYNLYKSHKKE